MDQLKVSMIFLIVIPRTDHISVQIAIKAFEVDKRIRVIVLTGRGKYVVILFNFVKHFSLLSNRFFCTGMDLGGANQSEMRENASKVIIIYYCFISMLIYFLC